MSFFSNILAKLGFGTAEAAEPAAADPAAAPGFTPAATPISEVDVVAKLEGMAASRGKTQLENVNR